MASEDCWDEIIIILQVLTGFIRNALHGFSIVLAASMRIHDPTNQSLLYIRII